MTGCPVSIGLPSGMEGQLRSRSSSWLAISSAGPFRSGIFWERTRYRIMVRQSEPFRRGWTLEAACLQARVFGTPPCAKASRWQTSTPAISAPPKAQKGKSPTVELFTGKDPEVRLDDWLPSVHRASQWNGGSIEEQVKQLAGHLKCRALQEWNLLGEDQVQNYGEAVRALQERLDSGSSVLAGQGFWHTTLCEGKSVAD